MALEADGIFLTSSIDELPKNQNYYLGDSVTLVYCMEGNMKMNLNETEINVLPEHILCVLPNAYCGRNIPSQDFKFILLRVKAELFQQILLDNFHIEPHWWEKQQVMEASPCIRLYPYYQDLLKTYHHLLELCLHDHTRNLYRTTITHSIVRAIIMELLNYMDTALDFSEKNGAKENVRQTDYTFRRFLNLLHQNPNEREVQWYAEQMDITPKYLSEICKHRSGKSASEWIAEITLADIKQRLLHTSDSIKTIALKLDFPNSSFFCQYVRKHTGMSPLEIRRQHSMPTIPVVTATDTAEK